MLAEFPAFDDIIITCLGLHPKLEVVGSGRSPLIYSNIQGLSLQSELYYYFLNENLTIIKLC